MNHRVDYKYWLLSAQRESLLIPIMSATRKGWSNPVNLVIYRRMKWMEITKNRKLP